MPVKRKWTLMLTLLALVLAACGTTGEGGDTTAAPSTETTAPETSETTAPPAVDTTAPPSGEEVALRWMTRPDNPEEAAVYDSISGTLDEQLEGITLTYEPGSNEGAGYQQTLLTNLSAGTAPDVFWIPGTDLADFVTKDVILDLRQYADATGHNDADFYPGPMAQLTTDPATGQPGGQLWGLPRDVSTFALYLNLDLIAEAGVENPIDLAANGEWTWEKFQEVSEGIAALGGEIKGYGQSGWWGPYGTWMNAAGGGFFNDDRTACGLDSDGSIAGLEFARDLYAGGSAVSYGEDAEAPFRAGTVGMFQNGRWATPGIRTVEFNWDVVGLPEGPNGPGNWLFWGAYVVNANTADPEAAWQLVQALTSAEVQAQISELGANIPSRVSQEALDAFLGFSPPANNQAFLDGLTADPATEGPLWAGSWPDYVASMDTAVAAVINGERDIADFQANICTETAGAFSG
jgi:multiple sugar transport system substrate-binding protein